MNEFKDARQMMVSGQIMPNKVNDESIVTALSTVPRENFIPKALRGVAYVDQRIKVADNRYVMEPMVLARLMLAADVCVGDLVLVVGGASGYEAAVLGQCSDAVVCLEGDSELAARSSKNLIEAGADNVAVVEGALSEGVKGQGPFDLIFINGAVEQIPSVLLNQMTDGGRLVCIMVKGGVAHAHMIERQGSELIAHDLFEAEASILPDFKLPQGFIFP